jgi:asparagine synthase (glutamine-hydrolysing)
MTFVPPDFVVAVGDQVELLDGLRLADAAAWPSSAAGGSPVVEARPAPSVRVWTRGSLVSSLERNGGIAAVPRSIFARPGPARDDLARWRNGRTWDSAGRPGRYAYVLWDDTSRIYCCTDAFRTIALHFFQRAGMTLIASDLRLLLATGLVPAEVRLDAVFHYLNLSYVPAPLTPIKGVGKVPAGHALQGKAGAAVLHRYWDAVYPEDHPGSEHERAMDLRTRIVATVQGYRPPADQAWGTFLSGGTDSSSIAGILARQDARQPVHSFSIGFDEAGFDELGYARIAARHFGLESHARRVDEDAAVAAIPKLVQGFDEPFGNSSAIASYYCASLAAERRVTTLVAGDGGDEIFGGNERYRKDAIYQRYHGAPRALTAAAEAAAWALRGVDVRWANRVKNFVRRGTLPNPDRFYTDDAFASEHFESLLTSEFRREVGVHDTLRLVRETYARADARSELNRLLYLDLKLTIADNDVVKVVKSARLAGVDVVFPYLDRDLVEFTGRLPVRDKLRGRSKRYLFKRSMAHILPPAIIRKKKQGFGLPVGTWLRADGAYHQLVRDTLLSPRCIARGIVQPEFVLALLERHRHGAWNHSAEFHMLLMLELWLRATVDGHA